MAVEDLAEVLVSITQRQTEAAFLPIELGTVTEDMVTGSDLRVKPDHMRLDLSYKGGELTAIDNVIFRAGDRVILVGINNGQDYVILGRLTKDPSKAVTGTGERAVARVGDMVDLNRESPTYGQIISGSERVMAE